jgi:hypothetical protein
VLRDLDDAQRGYVRAVTQLQLSDREAYARAWRDYQVAVQETHAEYQRRCAEATTTYEEQVKGETAVPTGAYDEWVAEVQGAWADAEKACQEAYGAYQDTATALWEESSRGYRDAFVGYVRALQDGLAGWDEATMFPDTLLRAAQAISVTAQWAAATPAAGPLVTSASSSGRAAKVAPAKKATAKASKS